MTYSLYVREPSGVTPQPEDPGQGRWLDLLLHALLPACCLGCGRPLPARGTKLGLCSGCRAKLGRLPAAGCAICACPLATAAPPAGWLCSPCRTRKPAFDRLLAPWIYAPPLDKVMQAFKFARLDYLGRHLAQALVEELGTALASFDRVVPVPLHWRRHLARGYNQAERIARPMAGLLGLPCCPDLRRRRSTPPQTSLGRESRQENLRGVFLAPRPARVRGRRILLIDDVATTGATLDAAAGALRTAGAAAITAVVAARTPIQG